MPKPDPYKWPAIGMVLLLAMMLPSILTAFVVLRPAPPSHPWAEAALTLGVEPSEITRGEMVYTNTCAVCHGSDAKGIPGLGKPVRNSEYVQQHSDDELFTLLAEGRMPKDPENTTGALMPARGAQGLSDSQLNSVLVYMRAIQDTNAPVASVDAWVKTPTGSGVADGGVELTGHPGYDLYVSSCAACHGQDGAGMDGLGLPLTTSGFVLGATDQALINFIKTGRPMWDEANVTGMDMPPKGGNPAITESDLESIVAYMRALQDEALGN